jgi:Flp pilus assembly protein TadG
MMESIDDDNRRLPQHKDMIMKKKLTALNQKTSRAQSMVEFALVLSLFLMLIFGIIEFGWFFYTYTSVYSASREASRYGAATGITGSGFAAYQDCQGMRDAAVRIGRIVGVTSSGVEIRYDKGPADTRAWASKPLCASNYQAQAGDRVLVRITLVYNFILPLVPTLPTNLRTLSTMSERSIVSSVDLMVPVGPSPTP